jgi:cytochrome P450
MAVGLGVAGVIWIFASYLIYLVANRVITKRQQAAKAKAWKCQPVKYRQENKLPFGIDWLKKAAAADKGQRFPQHLYEKMIQHGGPTFSHRILNGYDFHTSEPKNIQAILATQFADFDLGQHRRGNFFPLLGNGIFTQDGKSWEHSRAMMRPQFARDQVSDLNLEESHIQNLMRAVVPNPQDGNWTPPVDLQPLFFRLTLDTATEFLFGQSVNSQLAALPGYISPSGTSKIATQDFGVSFDRAQLGLAQRARFSDKYWLVNPDKFKEDCKLCHDFIDHFVNLVLTKDPAEKAKAREHVGKEKYVFLEALASQTRDPIELRSQMLHILLAGRDTTASLIGWVFYNLARDPERYQRLRNIIVAEFGTYSSSGPEDITFAQLKSCQYLQHVMNETLRLYPVVPINGRRTNKDTTLPVGGGPEGKDKIFLPKDTGVDYSVYVMHRRKDLWGDDANEFRPERWEGRRPGWEFLPVSFISSLSYTIMDANWKIVQRRSTNLHRPAIRTDRSILCDRAADAAVR